MAKTVAISDDVYEMLRKSRLPGESYSAAIRRILKRKKLSDIAGSRTLSLADWEEAKEYLRVAEGKTARKLMDRR